MSLDGLKIPVCPHHTCQGRCGRPTFNERRCSCDSSCLYFRDCCPDYEVHCSQLILPELKKTYSNLSNCTIDDCLAERSEAFPSIDSLSKCILVHFNYDDDTILQIITRCPDNVLQTYGVGFQCEHPADDLVSDLIVSNSTHIFYNIHCARCRGVQDNDLEIWERQVVCPTEAEIEKARGLWVNSGEDAFVHYVKKNCNLKYTVGINYDLIDRLKWPCMFISRCNWSSSQWNEEEKVKKISVLCSSFSSPVKISLDGSQKFKNVFCAMCNGANESVITESDICKYRNNKLPGETMPRRPKLPSFSLLVDVTDSTLSQLEFEGRRFCPNKGVYDATTGRCLTACLESDLNLPITEECYKLGAQPEQILDNTTFSVSMTLVLNSSTPLNFSWFSDIMPVRIIRHGGHSKCNDILNRLDLFYRNGFERPQNVLHNLKLNCSWYLLEAFLFSQLTLYDIISKSGFLMERISSENETALILVMNYADVVQNMSCTEGESNLLENVDLKENPANVNDMFIIGETRNNTYYFKEVPTALMYYNDGTEGVGRTNVSLICVSPLEQCEKRTLRTDEFIKEEDRVIITATNIALRPWEYGMVHTNSVIVCTQGIVAITAEQIVSTVACSLSLFCLFLTLLTYACLRELRTLCGILIMNLCFSLFVAQLLFSLNVVPDPSSAYCKIHTALQHFFWLSSFFWTSALALDMALRFSSSFASLDTSKNSTIMKYALYCYGLPLLVTVICVSVSLFFNIGFMYFAPTYCFIHTGLAAFVGMVVPISVTMVCNLSLFSVTVVNLHRTMQEASRAKADQENLKKEVIIYIRLVSLMGFNWLFGLLSSGIKANIVLNIIFAIFMGLQGVFIFVSFVMKKQIYEKWKLLLTNSFSKGKTNGERSTETPVTSRI